MTGLLEPEEFDEINESIRRGESFNVDLVSDGSVSLRGLKPEFEDDDTTEQLVFFPVRANSLTFIYLSGAWNHSAISYIIFINDVPMMFNTPLGWSFIPKSHYAAGRLGSGFRDAYNLALELMMQLINAFPDGEHG